MRRALLASALSLSLAHAAIAASTSSSGCATLEQAAADGMAARIKADDQNIQAPQSVTKLTCLSNFFNGTGLDVITNLLDPTNLLSAVQGRICSIAQNAWNNAIGSVQCGLTVTGFDLGFGLGSGTFCPRLSIGGNGTPIGNFGIGTNSSGGLYLNGSAAPPTGY